MFGWYRAVECEAHILYHLSGIDFRDEDAPFALCRPAQGLVGEGPEGDGSEKSCAYALVARLLNSLFGNACRAAECDDQPLGVVTPFCLVSHLALSNLGIFLLQVDVVLLHLLGLKVERGDDVWFAACCPACRCPRTFAHHLIVGAPGLLRRQDDTLHHLSDDAVGENHHGIAVSEGYRECKIYEVSHFLYGRRCENDDVIVTVSASPRGLEIVALRGLYGAEAGASSLHVDDNSGHFRSGHIRHTLLHESHSGA